MNGWSYYTLASKKFFLVYSNSVTTGYKIQAKVKEWIEEFEENNGKEEEHGEV